MKQFTHIINSLIFISLCGCSSDSGDSSSSSSTSSLNVSKVVDTLTPKSESTIVLTTSIANSTNRDLDDVQVKETCPTGSTYSANTAFSGTYDNSTGIWSIGTLTDGQSAVLRLNCALQHSVSGQTVPIPKTQILSPTKFDIVDLSVNSQFTVVPISADVVTTLSVNRTTAVEDEVIHYTILATNNGPDTATNLSLDFSCPTGSTYQSNTPSNGTTYNSTSGAWSVGNILRGNSSNIIVQCKVDNGTTSLNAAVNNISSNSVDSTPGTDTLAVSAAATTQCSANLTGVTTYNFTGDGLNSTTAFEIGTPEQLVDLFNNGSNDWNKEFILCQNINFTGITTFNSIGSSSATPFTGNFNGNGRTISNFNTTGKALFGFTQGATIRNLTFATTNYTCNSDHCGLLVDQVVGASSTTTFQNITIAGTVTFTNSGRYAAPVIGYVNSSSASLTTVANSANVTINSHATNTAVDSYTGSIVGYANNAGLTFSQVSNAGNFTSDSGHFGGLVGIALLNKSSGFNQISNTGTFNVTQNTVNLNYLGGLFGRLKINSGTGVVSLTNASSSGNITTAGVTAYNYVGGLFGSMSGHDNTNYINADSLSVTAITVDNDSATLCNYTGGIFGYLGEGSNNNELSTIANSTSAAQVLGCNYTGSFGGAMSKATRVQSSSASGAVTGLSYTGGFVGASDFNATITGTNYTGTAVTGTSIVGGFAGQLGYDPTLNTTASISSCNITNPITLTSTGSSVGGFVGTQYHSSSITNSTTRIAVFNITNSDNIAGFVGNINMGNITGSSATIDTSHVYADGISFSTAAKDSIGGFIGSVRFGGATISNSTTNIDVSGGSFVGGFVGFAEGNSADASNLINFTSNTSQGDVACSGTQCGGFIGRAFRQGSITNSTVDNAPGTLSGTGALQDHIGGFVGYMANDFKIVGSSTNLDVDTLGEFVGGFAGFLEGNADITDSKATSGSVVGQTAMGGFIGKIQCSASTVNSDGKCEILRNFTTLTSIAHHTPAATTAYTSAGFVADVRTNNDDTEISIEDNFSVVGTISSNLQGGGFIGSLQLEGDLPGSNDKIFIRRNYVGAGSLQAGAAIDAVHFGGFIGLISGNSALHQGAMTIEDNYTALTTINTSNFNAGSHFFGVGGFIGSHNTYIGAMIRRNYTSVQTISGNESARNISGFVGEVDQPAVGFTNSNYVDNFTTANTISQSSFEASFFYGILDGSVSPTESGNYYQNGVTCLEADETTACSARLTESGVALSNFQDDDTNAPLTNWDFTTVWQARASKLPALRCSGSGSTSFCTAWDANQ